MSASTDILSSNTPLPCPGCEKLFRLPEGFTANNSLVCPHCQKQVTGQEILDALAPTATIIGGSDDSGSSSVATSSSLETRVTHAVDEQDFVIPKPLKTATRKSRSRHPERTSSRRRSSRKKEASPGKEIAKIAFGGLLALPIAQLVLWWAFNADPLGLAPSTSKVASFIVPPKLRPAADVEEEEIVQGNKDMPKTQKMQDNRIPKTVIPK